MKTVDMTLDVTSLRSPTPMLKTLRAMEELDAGQVLMLTTSEPESVHNITALCDETGHKLLEIVDWDDEFTFMIRRAA